MKFILKCSSFTYLYHKFIGRIVRQIEKVTQIFFRETLFPYGNLLQTQFSRDKHGATRTKALKKQGEVRDSHLIYRIELAFTYANYD
jgi:hypothetical protein